MTEPLKAKTVIGTYPDQYKQNSVENLMRDAMRQVDERFVRVCERFEAIPDPVQLVEDRVTAPGVRLDPKPFETQPLTGGLPGKDTFVGLRVAPDPKLDRTHTSTSGGLSYTGPRRVWKVQSFEPPKDLIRGRPYRVRILTQGVRMGILSVRFMDELTAFALDNNNQSGSRWEVTYGIILKDIPNYLGRIPTRITALFEGRPGSSAGVKDAVTASWLSNTGSLHEPVAETVFIDSVEKLATEYTGPDATGWGVPSQVSSDYIDNLTGFRVVAITAEKTQDVYAQLNGTELPNMTHIGGNSRGQVSQAPAPVPDSDEGSALPASVLVANTAATVTSRTSSTIAVTDQVVEGMPLLYKDCRGLIATPTKFSAVIAMAPARTLEWSDIGDSTTGLFNAPTDDLLPGAWWATGLRITESDTRPVVLDLLVE